MVAGQLSLVFLRRIQMMRLVPLGLLLGFGAACSRLRAKSNCRTDPTFWRSGWSPTWDPM